MVVAHRDPTRLGDGARGAISQKWGGWQKSGLLTFVPRHVDGTTWAELRKALDGD